MLKIKTTKRSSRKWKYFPYLCILNSTTYFSCGGWKRQLRNPSQMTTTKSDKATLESKITSKQWKIFSKVRRNFLEPGCTTAEQISKVGETWNYSTNESSQRFTPNFPKTSCNKTESCSWRLVCFCGSCNPYEKLVLFVNWRGLRPLDNKSIVLSYYYILFGSQMALCSRAIQSSSIGSLFSSFQSESTALLFFFSVL